jgi:Ceramidase
MNWSEPVRLYCERTSAAFWAEPVNALTNAAFLLAAIAAFVQWRRAGGRDVPALALIVVLASIGFGSFAFHTLATRGAAYLDVIPIAVFIYGYLGLALRRFLRLAWLPTIAALAGFFAVSRVLARLVPPATLNGSLDYGPALIAMLIMLGFVPPRVRPAVALAAAVFIVSLVFRTIDRAICPTFPLGSHFVWHLLNAAVLFVLLNAAITNPATPAGLRAAPPAVGR